MSIKKMGVFKSSKINWYIMSGNPACDDWVTTYCADGDGMVQVVIYADRIELQDQLKVCKTWEPSTDIGVVMENAQMYLAATWHEVFEQAQHSN